MQKVDMTAWGGTKVRNNLKKVWPVASLPASADTDFGVYQQSLSTGLQNTNELIDATNELKNDVSRIEGVLARRPF